MGPEKQHYAREKKTGVKRYIQKLEKETVDEQKDDGVCAKERQQQSVGGGGVPRADKD